jgi:hypothetical protein
LANLQLTTFQKIYIMFPSDLESCASKDPHQLKYSFDPLYRNHPVGHQSTSKTITCLLKYIGTTTSDLMWHCRHMPWKILSATSGTNCFLLPAANPCPDWFGYKLLALRVLALIGSLYEVKSHPEKNQKLPSGQQKYLQGLHRDLALQKSKPRFVEGWFRIRFASRDRDTKPDMVCYLETDWRIDSALIWFNVGAGILPNLFWLWNTSSLIPKFGCYKF